MEQRRWGAQIAAGVSAAALATGCSSEPTHTAAPQTPVMPRKAPKPKPAPTIPLADPPGTRPGWGQVNVVSLPGSEAETGLAAGDGKPSEQPFLLDYDGPQQAADDAYYYLIQSRAARGPGYVACWWPGQRDKRCNQLLAARKTASGKPGVYRGVLPTNASAYAFGRLNHDTPLLLMDHGKPKDLSGIKVLNIGDSRAKKRRRASYSMPATVDILGATLNGEGRPTPRYLLKKLHISSLLHIFDAGDTITVFAVSVTDEPEVILLEKGSKDEYHIKRRRRLPFVFLPGVSRARDARGLRGGRHKAVYGQWDLLAFSAASTPPSRQTFAFAWVEPIAPKKYSPRLGGGFPFSRLKGANGCGGFPSRSLGDGSVKKRVHISRLRADGRLLSDRVYPFKMPKRPEVFPRVWLGGTAKNLLLNGKPLPKRRGGKPPPLPELPNLARPKLVAPQLVTLGYDRRRGKGLLILKIGQKGFSQELDSLGKLVGKPQPLGTSKESDLKLEKLKPERMLRLGKNWYGLSEKGTTLTQLSGNQRGKVLAMAPVHKMRRYSLNAAVFNTGKGEGIAIRAFYGPAPGGPARKRPKQRWQVETLELQGGSLSNLSWQARQPLRDENGSEMFNQVEGVGYWKKQPVLLAKDKQGHRLPFSLPTEGNPKPVPGAEPWKPHLRLRESSFHVVSYADEGLVWPSSVGVVSLLRKHTGVESTLVEGAKFPYLLSFGFVRKRLLEGAKNKGLGLWSVGEQRAIQLSENDAAALRLCPHRVEVAKGRWLFACLKPREKASGPPQVVTRIWRAPSQKR